MADTSFYIQHPDKLKEADFPELLSVQGASIHLMVPMVVVDELDQLKESKDRYVRWRARYTLAVLDRLFQQSTQQAVLHAPDAEELGRTGLRRGEVTVQLMFDCQGMCACRSTTMRSWTGHLPSSRCRGAR